MDDSLAALAEEFSKDFEFSANVLGKRSDLHQKEGISQGRYFDVDPQEGTSRGRYLDVDPQEGTSKGKYLNVGMQQGNRGKEEDVDSSKGKTIAEIPKEDSTSEPPSKKLSKSYCLLVNPKQKGNPILKSISNVPWEYDDIVPDYQMGRSSCALFLSLRYHNLNPDYIHERLKLLGKSYELRVLLVQVDIPDPHHALKNLTRICILADMTLILAWSPEEAGKIIETYKIFENKPPDKIMGKSESSSYLKLIQILTTIRSVNKTDAMTLLAKFRTLEGILNASEYQISLCPGFGTRKAKKLYTVLHENFCK